MTRWIVFDAMGVIFEEGDDILNRLVPFLRRRGCALDGEAVHAIYRTASLGQISTRAFWEGTGMGGEYPAIEREYLDTCLQLNPCLMDTAGRLANRFSLAVLSNDIEEWSAYLRAKYGLDRFFQKAVISSEVGVRKPAPEIYRILLDRLHAQGRDCLFIDDRLPNLAPAAALGIIPVWLTSEENAEHREIPYRIRNLSELPKVAEEIFSGNTPSAP
jgi:FMN phosphatase YigB (HAD superfamily)